MHDDHDAAAGVRARRLGPYFSAMVPDTWFNEGGQSVTGAAIDHLLSMHPSATEARASAEKAG